MLLSDARDYKIHLRDMMQSLFSVVLLWQRAYTSSLTTAAGLQGDIWPFAMHQSSASC